MVVTPTAPRVKTTRVIPPSPPAEGEEGSETLTNSPIRSPRVRKRTRVQRPAGTAAADSLPDATTPVGGPTTDATETVDATETADVPVTTDAPETTDVPDTADVPETPDAPETTGDEPATGAGTPPTTAPAATPSSRDDAVAELRGLLDAAEQAYATRPEREDATGEESLPDAAQVEGDAGSGSVPTPVAEAQDTDGQHVEEDSSDEIAPVVDDVEDARPVDGAHSVGETAQTEPSAAEPDAEAPAIPDAPTPRTEQESDDDDGAASVAEIPSPESDDPRTPAADDVPVEPGTEPEPEPEAEAAVETEPEPEPTPESAPEPAPARVVTVRTDSLTSPRSPRTGLAGMDETALTPSVRGDRAAAPELGDEVLVIAGLTKRFDEKVAVDDVALTVRAGSFYGIVGPNGAGKTTTMSMVTGLLRPDAGSVAVNGIDVWRDPLTAKRSIGVLPDRLRLFDRLTGAQLLHYSGALRGLDADEIRRRSADLVAAFGLEDAVGRLVTDYSAGMAKKVALACAMIHSPRLLVLDEPFESVDPVSAANIVEILQDYVAHGGTVVLSSHGMDFIQRICDHVAIIVNGRVLAAGTMDEVRAGRTLEERFVALAGGRRTAEGFSWLHSFSD